MSDDLGAHWTSRSGAVADKRLDTSGVNRFDVPRACSGDRPVIHNADAACGFSPEQAASAVFRHVSDLKESMAKRFDS